MSYVVPSVLVYQDLENAGGVANVTPDLGVTLIGPVYNVVDVDITDPVSVNTTVSKVITDFATTESFDTHTGHKLLLQSTKPGQNVDESSVEVHLTDAWITINALTGATHPTTGTVDVAKIYYTGSTNVITTDLPDASGKHLAKGDRVRITSSILTTALVSVVIDFGTDLTGDWIRISDSIATDGSTPALTIMVERQFDDIVVASTEVKDVNSVSTTGYVWLDATTDVFGTGGYYAVSGTARVAYRALRTDLIGTFLTLEDVNAAEAALGTPDERNPGSLAALIAFANTTTPVSIVGVDSDDLEGYVKALELLEGIGSDAYALVPLTQDTAIIAAVETHVKQMSTPEKAAWRIAIVNSEIPEFKYIGTGRPASLSAADAGAAVTGGYRITDNDGTFVSDGVTPGDILHLYKTDGTANNVSGGTTNVYTVLQVLSNQAVVLESTPATTGSGFKYYVTRELTKTQQADEVALVSEAKNVNRVWHIMPDTVGVPVNGVTKYLPGYYLCAAHGAMVAGFPVQQGFTNISVAGISDLKHSNFYFTKDQLNRMAAGGTCIYAQLTQGGAPYCRHALTTDMTVLEYREQLKVKNWDFLSYYYYGKMKGFIGSWNITVDTLTAMRSTIIASSELLLGQSLPRIGAPLLSYDLQELKQDENNKDRTYIRLKVEIVSPNNYTDIHLVI